MDPDSGVAAITGRGHTATTSFGSAAQVSFERLGSNQGPIRFQIVTYGSKVGCRCRLVSISYELLSPFHGGNTGSNPVGDAKPFQPVTRMRAVFRRHNKAQVENKADPPALIFETRRRRTTSLWALRLFDVEGNPL